MATLSGGEQHDVSEQCATKVTNEDDDNVHEILTVLNLSQYRDALVREGYDDLACFDLGSTPEDVLIVELVDVVQMKRPHARKLLRHLQELAKNLEEDEPWDELPMALNVERILPVPPVDFQALEKEIRNQMENEFAGRMLGVQMANEAAASEKLREFRELQDQLATKNLEIEKLKEEMGCFTQLILNGGGGGGGGGGESKFTAASSSTADGEYPSMRSAKPNAVKIKTPKDPNKPKRAKSAFMFYVQERRPSLRAENPNEDFHGLGKLLRQKWKALDSVEKAPFQMKADADKMRYVGEIAAAPQFMFLYH